MIKMSEVKRWIPPVLLLALVGMGCAGLQKSPEETAMLESDWGFHDIVDVDFVKAHVTVPPPDGVMIIDARPERPKYVKGHIPTAVSIPYTQFDERVDQLPEDKNALLIYYCGGFACKLSHKSARKAEALGYQNVKVFAAGFPAWRSAPGTYIAVSLDAIEAELADNRMLLVDARPKRPKFDKGHIPSAISIPFTHFEDLKGKLPRDPDTPVVFYCGGFECRLSHKAANRTLEMGYTDVRVFAAGYPAWTAAYGDAAVVAIKGGKEEGSIDLAAFRKIAAEDPESVMLIDVRDPDEFKKGNIPGSMNIPVDKLDKQLKTMKAAKPIVYICSTGSRSGEAYFMTRDLREDIKEVYYLEAGVTFNKDGSFKIKKPKKK